MVTTSLYVTKKNCQKTSLGNQKFRKYIHPHKLKSIHPSQASPPQSFLSLNLRVAALITSSLVVSPRLDYCN
jgi:hypothetical protein